jgi:DNA topoisomerase-2
MVFNKKRSDERKEWLTNYDRNSYLDTNNEKVSYTDFVNKELIHFSKYDCERSIPNMMDGLKISLRKILYSSFKKNLTSEIKVAQFSGYVSEQSGYHHGEASLNAAIVGMAQDYVGSNNINLLMPNGQFGTRLQGGKDSASERYIFTQLNPITRYIYRKEDDAVLEYLEDDGFPVEPLFYVPIIPMILVNGGKGIGTGFSTDVLSYSPDKIIEYLQCKLKNEQDGNVVATDVTVTKFQPSYRGFMGSCHEYDNGNKYIVKGTYQKLNDKKVRVTELPIGHWTDDFKQHIENLMEADKNKKNKAFVKDYNDMSTDTTVDIEITLNEAIDEKTEGSNLYNNFEKMMKLYTSQSTNNMHLFTDEERLTKFNNEREIIDRYFPVRLKYYQKRKDHMIAAIEKELCLLSNKARYIQSILGGEIDLRNMKKGDIVNMMSEMKYDMIDDDADYKYLLKMPMDSVSEENVERMLKDRDGKEKELITLQSTTIENMWLNELEELKKMLSNVNTVTKSKAKPKENTTVNKVMKIKKVVK